MLVQEPTYLGALQAFNAYEPRYDTLFAPAAPPRRIARRAMAAGGRVAFAYVVPDFANPSGETLTLARTARDSRVATNSTFR